ncbi:hypothetical protein, partial [Siminovitchia fortis]|uniref:hypothetical protein n=1 Tax=Siminovitchia fortis TaxID=254758 RepID=UPI001C92C249
IHSTKHNPIPNTPTSLLSFILINQKYHQQTSLTYSLQISHIPQFPQILNAKNTSKTFPIQKSPNTTSSITQNPFLSNLSKNKNK